MMGFENVYDFQKYYYYRESSVFVLLTLKSMLYIKLQALYAERMRITIISISRLSFTKEPQLFYLSFYGLFIHFFISCWQKDRMSSSDSDLDMYNGDDEFDEVFSFFLPLFSNLAGILSFCFRHEWHGSRRGSRRGVWIPSLKSKCSITIDRERKRRETWMMKKKSTKRRLVTSYISSCLKTISHSLRWQRERFIAYQSNQQMESWLHFSL